MSDWMDELLTELPPEPAPPDLGRRIIDELHARRRMARLQRHLVIASQILLAMVGMLLMLPHIRGLPQFLGLLIAWDPWQGLQALARAPWETLITGSSALADASLRPLAVDGMLALTLVALPAAFGLIVLVSRGGYRGRSVE
jgi:hypothetical protein